MVGLSDFFNIKRRRARAMARAGIEAGLEPLSAIAERIGIELEDGLDEKAIGEIVEEAWQAYRAPAGVTTLGRLEEAFVALEGLGVLCRHYPEMGRSEAYASIDGEVAAALEARTVVGFCFYDQFGAAAMAEGQLLLCYGVAKRAPTYAQLWRGQCGVADLITQGLRAAGFQVAWSGSAGEVIRIHGTQWRGPRDERGAPKIATGPKLSAPKKRAKESGPVVINVFVSGPDSSPMAHELIAAIAGLKAREMFGSVDSALVECAAVDYALADGRWMDLVAAPSDPIKFGMRRDLAQECSRLVHLTRTPDDPEGSWWSIYPPECRLWLYQDGDAQTRDGSSMMRLSPDASELGSILARLEALDHS